MKKKSSNSSFAYNPMAGQVQAMVMQAFGFHQQGQLAQAQAIYENVLRIQPNHADCLHLLGVIASQSNQHQRAIELIGKAIAIQSANPVFFFNRGFSQQALEQWEDALASYDKAIHHKRDYAEAYSNRGMALQELKRFDAAVASYDKAIAINRNYAEAHSNRANALYALGQWEAALAGYDKAIAIKPDYAEAYYNRGVALQALKRWDAALANYDKAIAIAPRYAQAYSNRGIVLQELKQTAAAIASYDTAIALKPDYADAYCNRGVALHAMKQWDAAAASYERAVSLKPDYAEAYSNLGVTQQELGDMDAAIASFGHAIALKPGYAEAYFNRAGTLKARRQLDEAVADYDRAIALKPDYAEAWCNRGTALQQLRRYDDAIASYSQAAAIKQDYPEAYSNRGTVYSQLVQLDDALADFDRAIEIDVDHADAYWNKAQIRLLQGDYKEGWRLYEWRWKSALKKSVRDLPAPLWLGDESLEGKTILLHCEQGFGDTLQFCRYVKSVADLGARVIVEAPEGVASLLQTLDGVSHVTSSIAASGLSYDFQCPLMSLPLVFKTTLETIPASIPYLRTDPAKAAYWKQKLARASGKRIGVVWAGGLGPDRSELREFNERRNMPLRHLAALNVAGANFYSLQKGESAQRQLANAQACDWSGPHIADFTDELHDFSDTAAFVATLDLVISVDTSVAHLAGALGKPVWLLNRYDTCWRWLLERADTPWYPSMRIFRQDKLGDWESVMAKVRNALPTL
jgi:tetratricopeptide (TPR) repeat protein